AGSIQSNGAAVVASLGMDITSGFRVKNPAIAPATKQTAIIRAMSPPLKRARPFDAVWPRSAVCFKMVDAALDLATLLAWIAAKRRDDSGAPSLVAISVSVTVGAAAI